MKRSYLISLLFSVIYSFTFAQNDCRTQDSLILVDNFYKSSSFKDAFQWNIYAPMNTWNGVTLSSDGCVERLELSNTLNFAQGKIDGLEHLTHLDLSQNEMSYITIQDYSTLPNLDTLNVKNNYLDFWDLGQIPDSINTEYTPQNIFGTPIDIKGYIDAEYRISFDDIDLWPYFHSVGHIYTWYKDGTVVDTTEWSTLEFSSLQYSDAGVYTCEITHPDFSDLTLHIAPVTLNVNGCRERDSLALTEFYRTINFKSEAQEWDLSQPMDTWYGITLSDEGCLERIELPGVLQGNYIWGYWFRASDQLTHLDLSGNQLQGIQDLDDITSLTSLKIQDNYLDFGDFLSVDLSYLTTYEYHPQIRPVPNNYASVPLNGSYNIETGHYFNDYEGDIVTWYKDSVVVTVNTDNSSLYLNNLQIGDTGDYFCEITNPAIPDLTISSNPVRIAVGDCRRTDSLALVTFTEHITFAAGQEWDLTQPLDTWQGVSLSDEGCVEGLNLSGKLTEGEITRSLYELDELQMLNLSDNNLTEGFYSNKAHFPNLIHIDLSNNQLSHGLNLHKILSANSIEYLDLSHNQISSLSNIHKLTSVKYFDFSHNNVKPQAFYGIKAYIPPSDVLEVLRLNDNQMNGSLTHINESLRVLELQNNQITHLTAELYKLPLLDTLNVANNRLTFKHLIADSYPDSYTYTPQDTIGNTYTIYQAPGSDYMVIADFNDYTENSVYTWYKDGNFVAVTNENSLPLTNLQATDAGNYTCEITNPQVPNLTLYTAPVTLVIDAVYASNCRLRDSLALVQIGSAEANGGHPHWDFSQPMDVWDGVFLSNEGCVVRFWISDEHMTYISPAIGMLSDVERIYLEENRISGTIPRTIGALTKLRSFDVSQNNTIHGPIPLELTTLPNLAVLNISQNDFDELPIELGNMPKLASLDVAKNHLTFEDLYVGTSLEYFRYQFQAPVGKAYTANAAFGSDYTIDLGFDENVSDNTYNWYRNDSLIATTNGNELQLTNIQTTDVGIYTCQVRNSSLPNLTLHTAPVTLIVDGTAPESPVYPGDANADGIVDNQDILFWGLAEGNTGTARPSASANWTPQPTPDWTTSVVDINGKHQDADGSGIVDEADLDIIEVNYLKTSAQYQYKHNTEIQLDLEPKISNAQSLSGNSEFEIELDLGSITQEATSIHGLAFTVDFSKLQHIQGYTVQLNDSDSWVLPSNKVAIHNPELKRSDFVITRTDLKNQTGIGNIGTLEVITLDLPTIETTSFGIIIRDIRAIQSDGTILNADDVFVGSYGERNNPNAFAATLEFDAIAYAATCDELSSATVTVTSGTAPYQYEWSNNDTNPTAENLLPGEYQVTVTDALGQTMTGLVIVPNGKPLPEINLQTTPSGQIEVLTDDPDVQLIWNGQQNGSLTTLSPGQHSLGISNSTGCSETMPIWVADISTNVLLEGVFDTTTLLMNDDLRKLGLLPLTDPYTGRMTTTNTVLQTIGNTAIVDWVLLELHVNNETGEVVSSYPALLRRDGEIVANDGISPIRIAVPETTDYYLVIKHRNHLPVKTTNMVTFTQSAIVHNFETGNDSRQKQLNNGSYGLYAADIKSDHTIDGGDKIIWSTQNGNFNQYHPADINLDGDINGADKSIWYSNNGVFTDIE